MTAVAVGRGLNSLHPHHHGPQNNRHSHHKQQHCPPLSHALSVTRMIVVLFFAIVFFGALLAAFSLRAISVKSSNSRMYHPAYHPIGRTTTTQKEESKAGGGKRTIWNDLLMFSSLAGAGDMEVEKRKSETQQTTVIRNTTKTTQSTTPFSQHDQQQQQWPSPSFDWERSTEENYALKNTKDDDEQHGTNAAPEYTSIYASIRDTLDYNYHKVYLPSRQRFQDSIISSLLLEFESNAEKIKCTISTSTQHRGGNSVHLKQPWVIFTAGVMGSGKTHTVKILQQKGRFPPNGEFVLVDPDHMRQALPEFEGYIRRNPEEAGERTRHEAGIMSEILTLAALQAGHNVLVDGSLRDADWYEGYFARLRREYPAFHIAILHITAPHKAIFERAKNRGKITGRVIPQKLLEQVIHQVPASIARLKNMVDFFVEIHNSGNDGEDVQLVSMASSSTTTQNMNWAEFTNHWKRPCHDPDHKPAQVH